ncbi:16S rRNA (uracil(1498)-N(3))-methyltransferase [Candidatus Parabeggiatoa sp. HSG14]|uniref:16S rRNA (uracil(1498)-N(3))-methyltransferase n=1 Tax=Candidatus Parabeggiatoa sp. HSG14 TaxID=3055593 RepID=UPI0025A7F74A|nr:16S rRNA (uracil(1498)-N(3))-methyltransferase [Thiotrichales bacterium HSG14]
MRLSRLYIDIPLSVGQEIVLPKESAHYLLNVLRLRVGTSITLFNGEGGEYIAHLITATKKMAQLQIIEYKEIERESFLQLTLVQAISRPEHINYTLQKSVELGVQHIVPVIAERSPPFDKNKISKREQHWQKIIISACEQSGRNRLPHLHNIQPLTNWLNKPQQGIRIVLSPNGKKFLSHNIFPLSQRETKGNSITVLIGAEGGLTENEIQQATKTGYLDIRLGARILRTETAAVTMLAICQALWGDLHSENP